MAQRKKTAGEIEQDERIRENIADAGGVENLGNMRSYQDFADLFEDRDPFEFL